MNHPKNLFFFYFKNVHHVRVNETTENKPGVYHYTITCLSFTPGAFRSGVQSAQGLQAFAGSPVLCSFMCLLFNLNKNPPGGTFSDAFLMNV